MELVQVVAFLFILYVVFIWAAIAGGFTPWVGIVIASIFGLFLALTLYKPTDKDGSTFLVLYIGIVLIILFIHILISTIFLRRDFIMS